jgi:hypothetical protein
VALPVIVERPEGGIGLGGIDLSGLVPAIPFLGGSGAGGADLVWSGSFQTAEGGISFGGYVRVEVGVVTDMDIYRPFGDSTPLATAVDCQLFEALEAGQHNSANSGLMWSHYLTCDPSVDVLDGCTRTASLNTLNYIDGDEVRIPSGGTARYVVVWVSLADGEAAEEKKVYLLRHSA